MNDSKSRHAPRPHPERLRRQAAPGDTPCALVKPPPSSKDAPVRGHGVLYMSWHKATARRHAFQLWVYMRTEAQVPLV